MSINATGIEECDRQTAGDRNVGEAGDGDGATSATHTADAPESRGDGPALAIETSASLG